MEYRTAARKVASPSHRPFRATDNDPFVVVCTAIAEHCDVAPVLGKIEPLRTATSVATSVIASDVVVLVTGRKLPV